MKKTKQLVFVLGLLFMLWVCIKVGEQWCAQWITTQFQKTPVGTFRCGSVVCNVFTQTISFAEVEFVVSTPVESFTITLGDVQIGFSLTHLLQQQIRLTPEPLSDIVLTYRNTAGLHPFQVIAHGGLEVDETSFPETSLEDGDGWTLMIQGLHFRSTHLVWEPESGEPLPLATLATIACDQMIWNLMNHHGTGEINIIAHAPEPVSTGLVFNLNGEGSPQVFSGQAYLMLSQGHLEYYRPIIETFSGPFPVRGWLDGELNFHCTQDFFQLTGYIKGYELVTEPERVPLQAQLGGIIPLRFLLEGIESEGGLLNLEPINITAPWKRWRTALIYGLPGELVRKYVTPVLATQIRQGSQEMAHWARQQWDSVMQLLSELTVQDLTIPVAPAENTSNISHSH